MELAPPGSEAPFDDAAVRAHLAHFAIAAGPTEARAGAEGTGPSIYITDPDGIRIECIVNQPDLSVAAKALFA